VPSWLQLIEAMLDGTMPVVRRQRFGIVDVRDVADLHVRAMAAPEAAGRRYLALGRLKGPVVAGQRIAGFEPQPDDATMGSCSRDGRTCRSGSCSPC
jgi:uncharacterized protein YbjT (DUF2867 family)